MKSKLMFLLIAGWITQGHGLKCYVCDMEQDGCDYNVSATPSSEVHLKECHPSAVGCLVLLTENKNYLNDEKRWYQRACLYNFDFKCFKIDSKKAFQRGGRFRANFLEVADCSNTERKALKTDYPQMDILSSKHVVATSPISDDMRHLSANYVKICEGKGDGCNHWNKRIMYPHHEGYDWDAAQKHGSWSNKA